MGYQCKPGGYEDNRLLNEAQRANTTARRLVERILTERPDRGLLYQLLAELAHTLSDQLEALDSMEKLRLKLKNAESPGTPPGDSQTDDDLQSATGQQYTRPATGCQGNSRKSTAKPAKPQGR